MHFGLSVYTAGKDNYRAAVGGDLPLFLPKQVYLTKDCPTEKEALITALKGLIQAAKTQLDNLEEKTLSNVGENKEQMLDWFKQQGFWHDVSHPCFNVLCQLNAYQLRILANEVQIFAGNVATKG